MKVYDTVSLIHTIILVLLVFFNFCVLPPEPDFPPRLENNQDIMTKGTLELGEKFIMYIVAKDDKPLTYEWYKDNAIIRGAENDTFVIDSLVIGHEGNYKCRVKTSSTSISSNEYELKIQEKTRDMLLDNSGAVLYSGIPQFNKSFFLYIKPINNLALDCQWYKDDKIIGGATNDTLRFNALTDINQGNYFCNVKHNSRTDRSLVYVLEMGNNPPEWSHEIMNVKIDAGALLKLSLKDSCKDRDNDKLVFTLLDGKPENDFINDQGIYEFQSNFKDKDEYNVIIKVTDGKVSLIGVIRLLIQHDKKTLKFIDSFPHDLYQVKEGDNLTIRFKAIKENAEGITYKLAENTLPRSETAEFDTKLKTLSWISKKGDKGAYRVSIEASHGKMTTKKTVDIIVGKVNIPPSISIPDIVSGDTVYITENETFRFTAKISDSDKNDRPTFSKPENIPKGAIFDKSSGIFTYKPEYSVSSEIKNKTFQKITLNATDNAVEDPLETKFVFHLYVRDKKFIVTSSSGTGGSIDPSGKVKAEPGTDIKFTITPVSNWGVKEVFVNGKEVLVNGPLTTYTFYNIQRDNTIKALFHKKLSIKIKSVAAGGDHTFFLSTDNTLWASGDNYYGQLGDRLGVFRSFPVKVLEEVKSISNGRFSSFAIRSDKTLWVTGKNDEGQLGLGDRQNRSSFTQVLDMENVRGVSKGDFYTLVVKTEGTLWTAGSNYFSPLGSEWPAPDEELLKFKQIRKIKNVIKACAGSKFSVTLRSDSTIWVVGSNDDGQLGVGDERDCDRFTKIPGIDNAVDIAIGPYVTFILKNDNSLWATGFNTDLTFSEGTPLHTNSPKHVLDDVIAIYSNAYSSNTLILRTDNTLWATGRNFYGEHGNDSEKTSETPIKLLDNIISASVGGNYSIVIKDDNSVWGTGSNLFGQLGIFSFENQSTFTEISFYE